MPSKALGFGGVINMSLYHMSYKKKELKRAEQSKSLKPNNPKRSPLPKCPLSIEFSTFRGWIQDGFSPTSQGRDAIGQQIVVSI